MYSFRSLGVALDGSDENGTMFGTPSNFKPPNSASAACEAVNKGMIGSPSGMKTSSKGTLTGTLHSVKQT